MAIADMVPPSVPRTAMTNIKLQNQIHEDNRKDVVVNPDYNPQTVRAKPIPTGATGFRCCMCGNEYKTQHGNFLSGCKSPLWKGNGGFVPFCKSCCEVIMQNLVNFYNGNEEHALRHICHLFDWYYDEMASYMTAIQAVRGGSRATLYPSKVSTRQVSLRGETYLDTVRDDYEFSKHIAKADDSAIVAGGSDADNDDFVVTKEMIRVWGAGFTKEQYRYLEEEYKDWITKNVCNTKSQEEIYRNIVLAQLDIRTTRERGGKVADAQKALQDLMNSAKILPKQTADNIIADTQTFGTLLKKYEETDPIPEPEERWKDVDGIRKYVNTWFRGGLAKALKINGNDNVKLYEEAVAEMNKYTVTRKEDGSETNGVDTSIFDNAEGDGAGEGEQSDGK